MSSFDANFTARELQVLALAWQAMETEPKVNYQKLADLTGYTEGSASVTFGRIKKKLRAHASGDVIANSPIKKSAKKKTPKKTPIGKRAGTTSLEETPTKKPKSLKANDDSLKATDDVEDEYTKVKPELIEHDGGFGYDAFSDFNGFDNFQYHT